MSLLTTALIVFENDTLREHENVDRLEPAFHWGLIHSVGFIIILNPPYFVKKNLLLKTM